MSKTSGGSQRLEYFSQNEEEEDDVSDQEEGSKERLLAQALPVSTLPKDADLSIPPTTGEEYLSRVRHEAKKCPDIVVAKIDLEKYKQKQTPQYVQQAANREARKEFKPSIEWQRERCTEFSELRRKAERERAAFLKQNHPSLKKTKLPKISNKSEWHAFCFGKPPKDEPTDDTVVAKDTAAVQLEAHEPLLSYLYKLDQASIIQLFDYHVEWFEEEGYSRDSFEWMYAVMSLLEKPILPETYSSLRSLARRCAQLRTQLTSESDEALAPFNLFIAIIGRYFEQFDLADQDDS